MSCGITVRDVQAHLAKIHMLGGARQRFSPKSRRRCPGSAPSLEPPAGSVYAICNLDALVVKVREDHILVS